MKISIPLINVNITDWLKWGNWHHHDLLIISATMLFRLDLDEFIKMRGSKINISSKCSSSLTSLTKCNNLSLCLSVKSS